MVDIPIEDLNDDISKVSLMVVAAAGDNKAQLGLYKLLCILKSWRVSSLITPEQSEIYEEEL